MPKPTIILRNTKGEALTHTELDSNFTNLQNATISVSNGTTTTPIDLGGTVTVQGGTGISVSNTAGTLTVTNTQPAPNSFGTITAGGVTIIADQGNDTFDIKAGAGISIQADEVNDSISIALATSGVGAGTYTTVTVDSYGRVSAGSNPTPAVASTVTLTADNTTNATNYPLFANAATGNLSPRTDTGFTYNPSTGALTSTSFVGALTGNVTGTVSGNAGSATYASAVTLTADNTTAATNYPLFANAATGNLSPRTDTGFTYNPSTGVLSTTQFSGSGAGLTSIPNSALTNSSITINGSAISLGGTVTTPQGTVTSVGGTGTVSGLTLSGTVTSTGSLTLGGTLSLATAPTIGNTTPNTGAFSTLTASTSIAGPLKNYSESIFALTYALTLAPDVANGNVQKVTLTGNVTISAFTNPVAGQSVTLIIQQDATGSRTLTSTFKFSGASKTLTTTASAIDVLYVFYDGTNYLASLSKGFV
jgi:hypothetical protein